VSHRYVINATAIINQFISAGRGAVVIGGHLLPGRILQGICDDDEPQLTRLVNNVL